MCATGKSAFIAQSCVSSADAEQSIRAQFFPASDIPYEFDWKVGGPDPIKLIGSTSAISTWQAFDTRPVSVDRWNVDFSGPCFEADTERGEGIIETLRLSVTTIAPSSYPIKTTGYLYDGHSKRHLGLLDLRYFGVDLPRTLSFSLAEHRLPMSTQIEIRFGVDGGGPPLIPRPPTITSVGIRLTESRRCAAEFPPDEVPHF
ncbi:hypothetical protein R69619_01229 [Paraburkholderia nemoris]|uniref:hypothetical protein n=1 Tax=Paraburkholderia nemoris TaxID=2793076 RepID=UPI00190D1576|nr:hypothetical protein [Paraburkholderia nemoris]MBK3739963.1 hypothetical protein [Paraburkholderia aspalathi]CAE6714187.1 hypothetical protein R69619_01229 [Paraburkholderia nemoris]